MKKVGDHKFCRGMVLEVVDKACIAGMKVARIIDSVDSRLHLQYEGGERALALAAVYTSVSCCLEEIVGSLRLIILHLFYCMPDPHRFLSYLVQAAQLSLTTFGARRTRLSYTQWGGQPGSGTGFTPQPITRS